MYRIPKFVIEKSYGIPKSLLGTHFSPRQNLEKSAEGDKLFQCFDVEMSSNGSKLLVVTEE